MQPCETPDQAAAYWRTHIATHPYFNSECETGLGFVPESSFGDDGCGSGTVGLGKRCVWSDEQLRAMYAVDHVIPFSLWHCDDLWNLLPSDAQVNGSKSDRLPERGLMFERKDAIVFYWDQVRQRHARRFEHELAEFTGSRLPGANWENGAFQRLIEAVETTAIQRGTERWRP